MPRALARDMASLSVKGRRTGARAFHQWAAPPDAMHPPSPPQASGRRVRDMMSSLRGTLSQLQRGGEDASLLEAESAVTVQALCRHVAGLQKGFIALRCGPPLSSTAALWGKGVASPTRLRCAGYLQRCLPAPSVP